MQLKPTTTKMVLETNDKREPINCERIYWGETAKKNA